MPSITQLPGGQENIYFVWLTTWKVGTNSMLQLVRCLSGALAFPCLEVRASTPISRRWRALGISFGIGRDSPPQVLPDRAEHYARV